MIDEKDWPMYEAMKRYGGGFVQALANCLMLADPVNVRKLKRTFPEYIKQYQETAKHEKTEVEYKCTKGHEHQCHIAGGTECKCSCGGRNHGKQPKLFN